MWVVEWREQNGPQSGVHGIFAAESDAKQCVRRSNEIFEHAVFTATERLIIQNERTEPRPPSAIEVADVLRTKIKALIRDAWLRGFDAGGPDDIGLIDEFALADAALDEHWPNEKG